MDQDERLRGLCAVNGHPKTLKLELSLKCHLQWSLWGHWMVTHACEGSKGCEQV